MGEINLLDRYPKTQRSTAERASQVTDEVRALSRRFGKEYFDGDRMYGYGGYHYHPRFWQATVQRFCDHYALKADARILDVGCAKGFMLHDFKRSMPHLQVCGIDISEYAIANTIESMRPYVQLGNALKLPFPDKTFDLVTSINTIHNLDLAGCKQALREIQRVARGNAFIVVDAWRNAAERKRLEDWVVTCRTHMHVDEWKSVFAEVGYTGDYYWFIVD